MLTLALAPQQPLVRLSSPMCVCLSLMVAFSHSIADEVAAPPQDFNVVLERLAKLRISSPSRTSNCLLRPELALFCPEDPLTLETAVPSTVFQRLLNSSGKSYTLNDILSESRMYPLATEHLPTWAVQTQRSHQARMNAAAIFGPEKDLEISPQVFRVLN